MKRKATLFATLLTGLLVASAVHASPFMLFDQLFGMGAPDLTTQGGYGRGYGPNRMGNGYGPQTSSSDVTAADVTTQGWGPQPGIGDGWGPCTSPPCGSGYGEPY